MAFDFPASPTTGQVYTPAGGGPTYTFSGYGWVPAAGIVVSDTPPASVPTGTLWWSSNSGTLHVLFDDGTSSQWVAVSSGVAPVAGSIVNTAYAESTAWTSTAVDMMGSAVDTFPQQTGGTQLLTVTITPRNVANKLRIRATIPWSANQASLAVFALFKDSAAPAIAAVGMHPAGVGYLEVACFGVDIVAGTTLPTTFKLRYGCYTGGQYTIYINGYTGRYVGGAQRVVLEVLEIAA